MRSLIILVFLSVFCVACKKTTEQQESPDPPPDNPVLSVDSSTIHLDAAYLSVARSFEVRYSGDWSISVNTEDTSWLMVSPASGTGNTMITVKAKNLHTGTDTRSSKLTITAGAQNAQSVQVEVFQGPYVFSSWSRTYGGTDNDYFKSVLVTDSGYIAMGSTTSRDGDVTQYFGQEDIWVVKTDRAGNMLWQRSYGRSGQDWPWQMIATDGGYLIVSVYYGNEAVNGEDVQLIKINGQGDVIWGKSYDRALSGIIGITEIASGFVLVGQTSLVPTSEENGVMMKIDKSGNFLWEKTFGGGNNEQFSFVTAADDGGVLAVGNRNFLPADDQTSTNTIDIWMVKTDADGNLQWQTQIGGSDVEICSSLTNTDDGGYMVSGWGSSPDVPVYHGMNDVFLAKVSGSGVIEWKKSLGGSALEIAPAITAAGDGEYIVATPSSSGDGDITNRAGDLWLFKINNSGEILWTKSGPDRYIGNLSIAPAPGSGYIVSGGKAGDAWMYSFSE